MKKIITGLALIALMFGITSISAAASKKSKKTPPELQKITFVHYAKDSKHSKPAWDDTVDKYKLMYGGIKWADTMQYEVNYTESGLGEDDVLAVLSESLETWDTAITGEFELFNNELVPTMEGYNSGDEINRITWGDLNSGIIAVNAFWFNTRTKEIVESDVVFNTDYDWSTGVGCPANAMDLQNIATHEFGHNGLNDLYMPKSVELTMHGWSDYGETDKRDLGTGDTSGIQALYGE